jgi:hypothetical protein
MHNIVVQHISHVLDIGMFGSEFKRQDGIDIWGARVLRPFEEICVDVFFSIEFCLEGFKGLVCNKNRRSTLGRSSALVWSSFQSRTYREQLMPTRTWNVPDLCCKTPGDSELSIVHRGALTASRPLEFSGLRSRTNVEERRLAPVTAGACQPPAAGAQGTATTTASRPNRKLLESCRPGKFWPAQKLLGNTHVRRLKPGPAKGPLGNKVHSQSLSADPQTTNP